MWTLTVEARPERSSDSSSTVYGAAVDYRDRCWRGTMRRGCRRAAVVVVDVVGVGTEYEILEKRPPTCSLCCASANVLVILGGILDVETSIRGS